MHPTHPRSHIDLHDWDKIVLDPVRVKRCAYVLLPSSFPYVVVIYLYFVPYVLCLNPQADAGHVLIRADRRLF